MTFELPIIFPLPEVCMFPFTLASLLTVRGTLRQYLSIKSLSRLDCFWLEQVEGTAFKFCQSRENRAIYKWSNAIWFQNSSSSNPFLDVCCGFLSSLLFHQAFLTGQLQHYLVCTLLIGWKKKYNNKKRYQNNEIETSKYESCKVFCAAESWHHLQ